MQEALGHGIATLPRIICARLWQRLMGCLRRRRQATSLSTAQQRHVKLRSLPNRRRGAPTCERSL